MERCKTCRHWKPTDKSSNPRADDLCRPIDPDTYQPMQRGFETRLCAHPLQTFFETPVASNTFALTDGSNYFACLATAEDFGCVLHEPA